jgi:hypothetical protein
MQNDHYTKQQLIKQATLSNEDLHEIFQCRRNYNRLGFAYQIGFVRLRNCFPGQSNFTQVASYIKALSRV